MLPQVTAFLLGFREKDVQKIPTNSQKHLFIFLLKGTLPFFNKLEKPFPQECFVPSLVEINPRFWRKRWACNKNVYEDDANDDDNDKKNSLEPSAQMLKSYEDLIAIVKHYCN